MCNLHVDILLFKFIVTRCWKSKDQRILDGKQTLSRVVNKLIATNCHSSYLIVDISTIVQFS